MKKFQINTIHNVFVDDFKTGEGDFANGYTMEATIKAETPMEALKLYFEKELYYVFKEDNLSVDDYIDYSVMVDADNGEATPQEIEWWKDGKITLYANNISIEIFELNKVTLDSNG
jgi:hypothetical protein